MEWSNIDLSELSIILYLCIQVLENNYQVDIREVLQKTTKTKDGLVYVYIDVHFYVLILSYVK